MVAIDQDLCQGRLERTAGHGMLLPFGHHYKEFLDFILNSFVHFL